LNCLYINNDLTTGDLWFGNKKFEHAI